MAAHRRGQVEEYSTVREILAEASTAADGVLWREHSDFGRSGFAMLGLDLHGFYSGLERFFELIGKHIDQNLPMGETWHRDLLERMAQDVTGVRPSVISPESERQLDSFRRFRHLVRNLYATNLVPEKMASLMDELPRLWPKLQKELLAFAKFLEYLAEEKD